MHFFGAPVPASDFRKMFRFKLSKIQMRERTNGKRRLTPLRLLVHAGVGQDLPFNLRLLPPPILARTAYDRISTLGCGH